MQQDQLKISRFNEPGPYYSSYPTLSEWNHKIESPEYEKELLNLRDKLSSSNIALYIHFPFCKKQCYYCACNAIISDDKRRIIEFQDLLLRELDKVFNALSGKNTCVSVTEIHFGGGSPSMLDKEEFKRLTDRLYDKIDRSTLKDFCIEVDPRTASQDKFSVYKDCGVTRLSFGVQELSYDVQLAINRVQPFELLQSLLTDKLREDFPSINFDILYGLPLQTYVSFMDTIQKVIQLSPDRTTLIRYAHIPGIRPHQRLLNKYPMPNDIEKTSFFFDAAQAFKDAGWEHIGIDHFARPGDSLATAARSGTMTRNFGGYSARNTRTIIGVGPSSTMRIGSVYLQNTYSLHEYKEALESDRFPVTRGFRLTSDDVLRREIIESILCCHRVDFRLIETQYGILFSEYFHRELTELQPLIIDGLVKIDQQSIEVTGVGRFFLRNVCKVFDKYLQNGRQYVINGP